MLHIVLWVRVKNPLFLAKKEEIHLDLGGETQLRMYFVSIDLAIAAWRLRRVGGKMIQFSLFGVCFISYDFEWTLRHVRCVGRVRGELEGFEM